MLKNQFKSQMEFDIFKVEQQIRMKNGYLTRSEREQLNKMLGEKYNPNIIKEEKIKLPIVTDINELRKPCLDVTKEDNIKEIVQKLKDMLNDCDGVGISANQIGIQKRISYIRIPRITKERKIEFTELVLINAAIIEKDRPIKINNEACLSFPGIAIPTQRYVFITVNYYDEQMKLKTLSFQDLESFAIQHEIDHQNGLVLFDNKWRAL